MLSNQKCEYDKNNLLYRAENVTENHKGDDLGSVVGHNDKPFDELKDESTQGSRDGHNIMVTNEKREDGHFDSEDFESDRPYTNSLMKINSGIKNQMKKDENEISHMTGCERSLQEKDCLLSYQICEYNENILLRGEKDDKEKHKDIAVGSKTLTEQKGEPHSESQNEMLQGGHGDNN